MLRCNTAPTLANLQRGLGEGRAGSLSFSEDKQLDKPAIPSPSFFPSTDTTTMAAVSPAPATGIGTDAHLGACATRPYQVPAPSQALLEGFPLFNLFQTLAPRQQQARSNDGAVFPNILSIFAPQPDVHKSAQGIQELRVKSGKAEEKGACSAVPAKIAVRKGYQDSKPPKKARRLFS
jgi:hypothetical protein